MSTYLRTDDLEYRRAATVLAVFVEQAFRRAEAHPNIPPIDFAVLRVVAQFDEAGISVPDLCQVLDVSVSSMVTIVKRFTENGCTSWEFPPEKRFKKLVRLTDKGRTLLESDPLEAAFRQLFSAIEPEDCRRLYDLFIRTGFAQDRWRDLKLGIEFWR